VLSSEFKSNKHAEHELLLGCVRPQTGSQIRSLVAENIDWNYLFLFARRHSVVSLLYSRLQENAPDLVPVDQLQRLQKYFQENAARNVLLAAELCRLIAILADAQIEAIPYKGPVLALFAYDNLALRRFVDLDIMVQKEDASKAIDLLFADGYQLSKPLSESQRRLLLRSQHNLQFRRSNRQLIVEMHWEVAPHLFASSVQADELWRDLVPIDLNGTSLKTLSPEDLIFSLCVHGLRHLWEKLLWICDVAWLLNRHDLNWAELLERSRRTNTERIFLVGLQLCVRLLHVSVPEHIERLIESDPFIDRLTTAVIQSLLNGVVHQPASSMQILRFNLMVRRSWLERARYFRHILKPTDRDLDSVSLPGPLSFGYYLMRPFRLLFKTGEHIH
jgi:hypothetical protein